LLRPTDVTDRKPVGMALLVSEVHRFSDQDNDYDNDNDNDNEIVRCSTCS